MAVKTVKLGFTPPLATDVVSYQIIVYDNDGAEILKKLIPVAEVEDGTGEYEGSKFINLSAIPELAEADGEFDIEVSAIDDQENESVATLIEDVDLDFLAPDAPTNLFIVRF